MSKRKAYVDEKTLELGRWKAELEELKRKAQDTSGELNAKLEQQMVELQRLREEGGARLKKVVGASEEAWEHFREDAEHTWKAFRSSVNYFKSHFKDRDDSDRPRA